jgi:hypothetical protein
MNIYRACLYLWGAILVSELSEHKYSGVLIAWSEAIKINKRYVKGSTIALSINQICDFEGIEFLMISLEDRVRGQINATP